MLTRLTTSALQQLLAKLGFWRGAEDVERLARWCGPALLRAQHPALLAACAQDVGELDELVRLLVRLLAPELTGGILRLATGDGTEGLVRLSHQLLLNGAPANWVDQEQGWTALMVTADGPPSRAHDTLAECLVAAGCPLDAVSPDGTFALLLAYEAGNLDQVLLLLDLGASLSPPGSQGFNEWLTGLPELASDRSRVFSRWGELAHALARGGCSVHDAHGWLPPLLRLAVAAARAGCSNTAHWELLDAFLELGADARVTDAQGHTALHLLFLLLSKSPAVSIEGCQRIVSRLVAAGCDPNSYGGDDGMCCLAMAVHRAVPRPGAAEEAAEEGSRGRSGPDWQALVGVLLEAGADPAVHIAADIPRTPLRFIIQMCLHQADDEGRADLPQEAVSIARALGQAEWQRSGRQAVRDGPQILHMWLVDLFVRVFVPSGEPFLQPSPTQLEMTQVLAKYCCSDPWPEGATVSPSALLCLALQLGSTQILGTILGALPPEALRWVVFHNGDRLETLSMLFGMTLLKLDGEEEPPPEDIEKRGIIPALQFWRQVGMLFGAGLSPGVLTLRRPPALWPPWSQEYVRFVVATGGHWWGPSHHSSFPTMFREAAKQLLLINSRGFGAAGHPPGRRLTRSGSRVRREGLRLPEGVIMYILGKAACPVLAWVPQLHPHLYEVERQWLEAQMSVNAGITQF